MNVKTILLVINQGFSARYLLRSDFYPVLKESGVRLIILSPSSDEEPFIKEFGGENVFFELFKTECHDNANKKIRLFFTLLRLYSFKGKYKNNFTEYWRERHFTKRQHRSLLVRTMDHIFRFTIYLNCRSRSFRKLMLALEAPTVNNIHQHIFEKYRPNMVIATSLGMLPYDSCIMTESKRYGALTMSIILSWDNTTTKGMAGCVADYAVAWTETMKHELVTYHDMPDEKVFVGGVPQYDTYFKSPENYTKESVYKEFGLDPSRKTIFYCLESPTAYVWNVTLVKLMARLISENRFTRDCQLLVRLHPIYYRVKSGVLIFEDEINKLKTLQETYPFIYFDHPETISRKMSFDMPKSEIYKLGKFLKITDVLVCFYSSMMIEASIFDVPIVNISLYHKNELPNEVMGAHAHNKRVQSTGGVRIVCDEQSLIDNINRYLDNPSADREARQKIADNESGPNRGEAGKTIARHVLSLVHRV